MKKRAKKRDQKPRLLINGLECDSSSPKKLLKDLLSLLRLGGSSLHVLIQNFEKIIEVFTAFSTEYKETVLKGEKASWTRMERSLAKQLRWWKTITEREVFITKYYDLVLSLDGLGALPGFGLTNNFGDKLKGNPERKSMRKIDNLL